MAQPSIETSIDIAAPRDAVWAVLSDLPAYTAWNPFITEASGSVARGQRLRITVRPPGAKPMRFAPTVLAAEPGRLLVWRGRVLIPGLFDGTHWFRLEDIPGGTRLVHGEKFAGLLVMLMRGGMFAATHAGFEAMNRALKARVEG